MFNYVFELIASHSNLEDFGAVLSSRFRFAILVCDSVKILPKTRCILNINHKSTNRNNDDVLIDSSQNSYLGLKKKKKKNVSWCLLAMFQPKPYFAMSGIQSYNKSITNSSNFPKHLTWLKISTWNCNGKQKMCEIGIHVWECNEQSGYHLSPTETKSMFIGTHSKLTKYVATVSVKSQMII